MRAGSETQSRSRTVPGRYRVMMTNGITWESTSSQKMKTSGARRRSSTGGSCVGLAAMALKATRADRKSTPARRSSDGCNGRSSRAPSLRPAESSAALRTPAWGDLFDGALDDVLLFLSAVQRALEVALLVEDAGSRPVDTRALGRGPQLAAARRGWLVVAIDDLELVDASSAKRARKFAFAGRRRRAVPPLGTPTARCGRAETSPVETGADVDRIDRVELGRRASQRCISGSVRDDGHCLTLAGRTRHRGKLFDALEAALRRLGTDGLLADPTQPLLFERLQELVSTRLDGFNGATRACFLLALQMNDRRSPKLSRGDRARRSQAALAEQIVEVERGSVIDTAPGRSLYQGAWSRGERADADVLPISLTIRLPR